MTKILIVEDNEMNRDMLTRRLKRRGYDIVIAEDAQEFGMSDDLRKSLGKSGGLGRPEVSFIDEIS